MTEGVVFIGAIIVALTQVIKFLSPKVTGIVTVVVAVLVGILVALLDREIGVVDITIAQGILIALAAVGTHTTITARSVPPAA